jgi:hypothetical protein
VDGRRVAQHQFVQFAKRVRYDVIVKDGRQLLLVRVNAGHKPDIAVIDILVIVVHDLHNLVSYAEVIAKLRCFAPPGAFSARCSNSLMPWGRRSNCGSLEKAPEYRAPDSAEHSQSIPRRNNTPSFDAAILHRRQRTPFCFYNAIFVMAMPLRPKRHFSQSAMSG